MSWLRGRQAGPPASLEILEGGCGVESKNQAHELSVCGARKKQGGICRARAGRGTKHPGTGRCKHHGGASTGPVDQAGNKNALKTGRHESILVDVLEDDEQELFGQVNTDALAMIEEELRIITIRERRMLKRIADLKAADGMTLVEESTEVIGAATTAPEERRFSDRHLSEMATEEVDAATGANDQAEQTTKVKQKRIGTLGQIQAIEADLTAVQAHKAKLIKMKADIHNPQPSRLNLQLSGPNEGPIQVEVGDGLSDDQRAAGVAALLERARARAPGQLPPTE